MGKILNGLKALGQKMTGEAIRSNRIGDCINEIAENYSGGGSGGGITTFKCYKDGSYARFVDVSVEPPKAISESEVFEAVSNAGAESVSLMLMESNGDVRYYTCRKFNEDNGFYFYTIFEHDADVMLSVIQLMRGGAYFNEYRIAGIPIM